MILGSNGTKDIEELEPKVDEAEERTMEQLEREETRNKDLSVSIGPMTRSRQAIFHQALHQLLYTIQGSLVYANPTTLVVIQAT
ncbi:unnamed protein product [Cochlearia groenlandica]